LYGGYRQIAGEGADGALKHVETMKESMLGTLGAIDAPGLLQSIASAKKNGLLSIENIGKTALIQFANGKVTAARLGKLVGSVAVVEVLVAWRNGIFLFRNNGTSEQLDESCKVDKPLDQLLLGAALAEDQINQILNLLPSGRNTVLEQVWNFESAWNGITQSQLKFFDDTPVLASDRQMLFKMASLLDGLSTLDELRIQMDEYATHQLIRGTYLLLECGLAVIQQASFFRVLSIFQSTITQMQQHIPPKDNLTVLQKSLHYVHGATAVASRFKLDEQQIRIGINLNEVKKVGVPVSTVIADLRRWMEAYLAYCRRLIGTDKVDAIVSSAMAAHPDAR
jgi:hypothetical protein